MTKLKKLTGNYKGDALILTTTLFWGASYYFSDETLEELGPFTLITSRFICAFILMFLMLAPKMLHPTKTTIKHAALTGLLMTIAYALSNFALLNTNLTNAGFLCSLPVILVPIIGSVFFKRRPGAKVFIVVAICVVGIALLTLRGSFIPRIGDIYAILSSVSSAFFLIIVENGVQRKGADALQLGVYMQLFIGVFSLVPTLIFERPEAGLITLPQTTRVWLMLIFLIVFCTAFGFVMQVLGQQYTTAEHAGVIFALEPVIAAILAFFIAGDILPVAGYIGCILVIISLFAMELPVERLFAKHNKK